MGTFLRHIALFSLLPALVVMATLLKVDDDLDLRYARFTTARQSSLIFGSSRAAQGVHPHVLDSVLRDAGQEVRSYNYAFEIGFSNYGPAYTESIRKKLDPTTRNGVFVVCVDPWSICCRRDRPVWMDGEEDAEMGIGKVSSVNADPNFAYLFEAYDEPLLSILLPDPRPKGIAMHVKEDGLLEVELPMAPDPIARRTQRKVKEYREVRLPVARPSAFRLQGLGSLIDMLKDHGTVVLVRLPVAQGIMAVEDELVPGFSMLLDRMAQERGVRFIDLYSTDEAWTCTDGTHLAEASGVKATAMIARAIAAARKDEGE